MRIEATGILGHSKINTKKACYTFSSFIVLSHGTLLAAARCGDNKDSELETVEFFFLLMRVKTGAPQLLLLRKLSLIIKRVH